MQDSLFADAPKPADLFDEKTEGNFVVKDGITDAGLAHFSKNYAGEKISKNPFKIFWTLKITHKLNNNLL